MKRTIGIFHRAKIELVPVEPFEAQAKPYCAKAEAYLTHTIPGGLLEVKRKGELLSMEHSRNTAKWMVSKFAVIRA